MGSLVVIERLFALLISCCENIIHGGIIFGWPSLVFILKQLGYFSDGCPTEDITTTLAATSDLESNTTTTMSGTASSITTSCDEQDASLQLIFSITTAIQACCMFPVGYFFDRFGTRISRLFMCVLMLAGYLLVGFSSPTLSYLLFPGTICFTVAGVSLLLSSMQTGNLFKTQKSTAITVINSMYSASVVVLLIAKIAYEAGFSINNFFFILAGSVLFLSFNTVLFFPIKNIPWPLPDSYRIPFGRCSACSESDDEDVFEPGAYDNKGFVGPVGDGLGAIGHYRRNLSVISDDITQYDAEPTRTPVDPTEGGGNAEPQSAEEDRKKRAFTSLGSCILSTPFLLLLVWQMLLELDMVFTFGALNLFLTRLADGDENLVSHYTDVFSITQLFVLIVGPLGGLLMDRNKLASSCSKSGKSSQRSPFADMQDSCLPLAVSSLASIGYSVCFLIPSLQLQYLTFVFVLILRSLLFGVGSAVVAVVFPMQYFASVYGAIRTVSGFVSFLQYPIFILLQTYLDNDPFYITIGFIVADAITLVLPIALYISAKRKSVKPRHEPASVVI